MEMLDHDGDAVKTPVISLDETVSAVDADVVSEKVAETLPDEEMSHRQPSIDELMARLRDIAEMPEEDIVTDEVGRIKQQFYHLRSVADNEAQDAAGGSDGADSSPDEEFKALLAMIKEKKAALRARIEAVQLTNLERKRAITAEIRVMSDDTDNVNRHYPRIKELQAEFKEIGDVPQQNATETWKAFQEAIEHFYDQWKVNKELRDYDFKKNFAEKQLLIDEAARLKTEPDVITAFRRLQDLHDKWRGIGPVAKEFREEVWNRFKDESAEISKRYQEFFEERKLREHQNEEAKTALCEKIEAIDIESLKSYSAWNKATQTIIEAQEEWKTLGFASRKSNNALFARFRQTCDRFFAAKADFFHAQKAELARNLEAKTQLCIQAEALKDSTDWKATTDKLVALQQQWKTIGAVAKKQSDAIWKRFLDACDYFFSQKKAAMSATRKSEQANLAVKRGIITELTALNAPDASVDRETAIAKIHELRATWQQTGHVPFKEKERLSEIYRETVRQLFDKYDIHENRARQASFEASINEMSVDSQKLLRERERLMRVYENRRAELQTYENNLGFFNAKTKTGNTMIADLQNKIRRIKADLEDLEGKIKLIDSKLK